ncbi:hypothetical protein ACFL35_12685 [Candidatus Riflebacteria bacterium]
MQKKEMNYTSVYLDDIELKSFNFYPDENIIRWIIEQENTPILKKRLTTVLAPKILEFFSIQYDQEKQAFIQFMGPTISNPVPTDYFVGDKCRTRQAMEFTQNIIIEHISSHFPTQDTLPIPFGIYWYLCQVPEFKKQMIAALKRFCLEKRDEAGDVKHHQNT